MANERIGIENKRAVGTIWRPSYRIGPGDEFTLRCGNRSFIIRGVQDSLQVFSTGYLSESKAEDIFGGTIYGVVTGVTFTVGYAKDIKNPSTIPTQKV